mmetsp:Transcript_14731/g.26053  ORF Transcript_14731/g.26053 Transcript_14731/m.26053 type:complete len:99 (+) Transcript_14731:203-499(+)
MLVRKCWSWETQMMPPPNFFTASISASILSMSKWFVGSSSSSSVGRTKRARASATRMRHPPDMSLVDFAIICLLKPRPCSSSEARTSNVEGSSASIRS